MKIPKAKIEERAIGALSAIVDMHPTMRGQFYTMDKEMSWDGYIWIFNSQSDQCKDSFDDKVSVQIKGHIDQKERYLNEQRITYAVDLADLKVYFKSTGVLYFVVFMSENGEKREVFYTSLFPSKIKAYLDEAEKKGNRKNKSIPFTKLEKNPEDLYIIVKQFSIECKKQGFGDGPIVQSTIEEEDLGNVETIVAQAVGAGDEKDFLKRLSTGNVCIYGKVQGSSIPRPITWKDTSVEMFTKEVNRAVEIKHSLHYIEHT